MKTISIMSHVFKTKINFTTQFHNSELQTIFLSSSQINDLTNTLIILSSDKTLILIEAISKYVKWKINSSINLTMIFIEHDKMNAQTWRIWYVLRNDKKKTIIILLSQATYYHENWKNNKQKKIIKVWKIYDEHVNNLIISQNNHQHLLNQFLNDHQNQKSNDKLRHQKNMLNTFDDFWRWTQIKKIMKIAHRSYISQKQKRIENDINEKL